MDEQPVIIKVDNVSKVFKLPHEKNNSIKSAAVNFYRRDKGYDLQSALKNVSIDIRQGEFFGIVGRNGSGKSTLLKVLAGIYYPTEGQISVGGSLTPFIELGVGFNPELTGRENIYLNGALLGFSRKQMTAMYSDIVGFAELEKFMDQKLKNYSSGMQVRLAFSIAIRAESDVLLIDEVLAVGDADFQRKCFDYFKTLKKEKKTVILVSHDMNAVREFCDRAVLIDKGEVVLEGVPETVARKYSSIFDTISRTGDKKSSLPERAGSGHMKIMKTKVTVSKDEILIETVAHASKKVEALVYGLHILGQDGREITAMNNRMIGTPDIKNIKPGTTVEFAWKMLNIFTAGQYYVMLTLTDGSYTPLDFLYEAAEFYVSREERSNTSVLPPVVVTSRIR